MIFSLGCTRFAQLVIVHTGLKTSTLPIDKGDIVDIALLANVPLFHGLDKEALQAIASQAVTQQYPKNSILVYEGEEPDALYIIVSGRAKVYVSDEEGKELVLNSLSTGEFFGELALIDGAPRSATVMTTDKSTLIKISQRDFAKFMQETPGVAMNVLKELAHRVRGVNEHIRDLALLDVYGRVARTLLRLAKETDEGLMTDAITQQEIANMVGASREMVSRVLNNLKSDGYISVREKRIKLIATPPLSS